MSDPLNPVEISHSQHIEHTVNNPWQVLRKFTAARIGLGRAGVSVPTQHLLDFQLAHAQAQDAVHMALDIGALQQNIISDVGLECDLPLALTLHSQAKDRAEYLQRPDLGRRLNDVSLLYLSDYAAADNEPYDLAIVIADGLSSLAVENNAPKLLAELFKRLQLKRALTTETGQYRLSPLVIVQQGRVAIADEIGACLNVRSVVVLIGERPGLSSPDSLGLYLTWAPEVGLTDESRNCISNVRPEGLSYKEAVNKLCYLLDESQRRQLSGIHLKEDADNIALE